MSFGFGTLRLSPIEFWSLSPRELHRALVAHGAATGAAFDRSDLLRLMQAFPDERFAGRLQQDSLT